MMDESGQYNGGGFDRTSDPASWLNSTLDACTTCPYQFSSEEANCLEHLIYPTTPSMKLRMPPKPTDLIWPEHTIPLDLGHPVLPLWVNGKQPVLPLWRPYQTIPLIKMETPIPLEKPQGLLQLDFNPWHNQENECIDNPNLPWCPSVNPVDPSNWDKFLEWMTSFASDLFLSPEDLEIIFVGGLPVAYFGYYRGTLRYLAIYSGYFLLGKRAVYEVRKALWYLKTQLDKANIAIPVLFIGGGITTALVLLENLGLGLGGIGLEIDTLLLGAAGTGIAAGVAWALNEFGLVDNNFGDALYNWADYLLKLLPFPNYGGNNNNTQVTQ